MFMETKNSFWNFTIEDYSSKYNNVELFILSALSLTIPLFLGHPQLLIGSIINALLFRAALTMNFKKSLPIILLPSVGAYLGGVLFGGATAFLLYFIPVIWLANFTYIFTAKFVSNKFKKNYGSNVLVASVAKSALLFSAAFIAVTFFGFPAMFLTAMGLFQLYTALIGGTIATLGTKLVKL